MENKNVNTTGMQEADAAEEQEMEFVIEYDVSYLTSLLAA